MINRRGDDATKEEEDDSYKEMMHVVNIFVYTIRWS